MTWPVIMEILTESVGKSVARDIEKQVIDALKAKTIYIPTKQKVYAEEIEEAAPGKPAEAAKKLGIPRSTAYYRLKISRSKRFI